MGLDALSLPRLEPPFRDYMPVLSSKLCKSQLQQSMISEVLMIHYVVPDEALLESLTWDSCTEMFHRDIRNPLARVSGLEQKSFLSNIVKKPNRYRSHFFNRKYPVYNDSSLHSGVLQKTNYSRGYQILETTDSETKSNFGNRSREQCFRPLPGSQEETFSTIEPYPLPEPPSLLLLEPLLLIHDVKEERKRKKRRKEQLTPSEQQKVARIMIAYTLAFFFLAIITFYVVYFV